MVPASPSSHETRPPQGVITTAALVFVAVLALGFIGRATLPLDVFFPFRAGAVLAAILLIAAMYVSAHHPHTQFGPANQVTTIRAGLLSLLAALVGDPGAAMALGPATVVASVAIALDGVDGWLARRTRLASPFGARFDMEIDALLILVLSTLAWQTRKAGSWILVAGLLRYIFLAAGLVWAWIQHPLTPSVRRQTACVIQILGLILVIMPPVVPPASTWIAAVTLTILAWSFLVDVRWLWRQNATIDERRDGSGHVLVTVIALLLLNVSLTFQNIWPTPWIGWYGEVSVELTLCLLLFALLSAGSRRLPRVVLAVVTIMWSILVVWRYIDVTAPALYGRDLNLFWDIRYIPDVASMFGQAVPLWLSTLAVALMVALGAGGLLAVRWALGQAANAMTRPRERRVLVAISCVAILLFAGQRIVTALPALPAFTTPVSVSAVRQARLVLDSINGTRSPAPSPRMDSDLARVSGADVVLIFVESYGAVTYDNPAFAKVLTPGRDAVERAVRDTGQKVVSAFVESPTFGGSSWLAHISFLSGVEVRDPDTNALLMAEDRDTLVTTFKRHGYRTVALMPGLWYPWPEGSFYGFDDIYNALRFDYRGPHFGWWAMSDQYVLASLGAQELDRADRPPVFVFFPSITTHAPFSPTPPYQPDWRRMLTPTPYDEADLDRSSEDYADWLDLSPGYVRSVGYFYSTLAGFLRERAGRDTIFIVMGDHQPAAAVTGEAAPWDVPVHIISTRTDVLDRFISHGFQEGLNPPRAPLGRMHELVPMVLDAFGSDQSWHTSPR